MVLLSFTGLAEEDIRAIVQENKKVTASSSEIDVGKHIFGHAYGVSENDFIAAEGKPDGYINLSGGKTVMIYGKDVGFVFQNKKLIGVRITSSIMDWVIANEIKSKSRFDGINWRVKQGVFKDMSKEDLVKNLGDTLKGEAYEKFLQIGDDRLVIRFSSSRMDGGDPKFTVHGIYLTRE
jgi:hypothetical protein